MADEETGGKHNPRNLIKIKIERLEKELRGMQAFDRSVKWDNLSEEEKGDMYLALLRNW